VPWLDSRAAAGALTIAALVATGVLWAPLLVMLSDACTAAGVGQIMAVVIIDLTWPPGNALGAAGGAAIAQAAGQRWAYATMAAALLGGYLALGRSRGPLAAEVQAPPA
jgi:hypothetical protein